MDLVEIARQLRKLTPRQEKVIRLYFGLGCRRPHCPERVTEAKTRMAWPAVAAVLALALIGLGLLYRRATRPVERPLVRLSVDLGPEAPAGTNITAAVSPDGRRLVFPARGPDGTPQLDTRLLDQKHSTPLPGTENGSDPFFSPDGQWVGFFADGKLKKVPVQGGAPVVLCVASGLFGATWGEDGKIVVALGPVGTLSRVPEGGGTPEPVTKLRPGETNHRWPQILPGDGAVVFTASDHFVGQEDATHSSCFVEDGPGKDLAARRVLWPVSG